MQHLLNIEKTNLLRYLHPTPKRKNNNIYILHNFNPELDNPSTYKTEHGVSNICHAWGQREWGPRAMAPSNFVKTFTIPL